MKTIHVWGHGGLLSLGTGSPHGPTEERQLEFEQEEVTVRHVLASLGMEPETAMLMVLERRLVGESEALADGDALHLYPVIGGG